MTPYGNLNYNYSDPSSGQGQYTSSGTYIPQTTVTQTLAPDQQKLLDQSNQISTALNDQAIKGIGYVDQATSSPLTSGQFNPLQYGSGVSPNYQNVTNTPQYQTSTPTSQFQTNVGQGNDIKSSYDFSNLNSLPTSSDAFSGDAAKVQQALLDRLSSTRTADRSALDAKLANQGINLGSSAYGTAQGIQGQKENDENLAAAVQGYGVQNQLYGQSLATRQQLSNEDIAQGNYNNTAQGQMFSQGLANANLANSSASALFGQNQQNLQNYNTAQQGTYDAQVANANMNNQNQTNLFNQGLANAQLNNQATGQAISQADYFKNQPLNMLNALRSGNQVTNPNFVNNTSTNIAAAPIYQATADAGTAAQQAYQQQMAGYSSLLGGLGSIGGAAIKAYA